MTTTIEGAIFFALVLAFDLWLVIKTVGRRPGEKKKARLSPDLKKEGNRVAGHP